MNVAIFVAFMAIVAVLIVGVYWLVQRTIDTVTKDRQEFFVRLAEIQATAIAERTAQHENFERLMDANAEREHLLTNADKEWLESPESVTDLDRDLDWGSNPNG